MGTQHANQLTHEEALELLPWHVNSTLEKSVSDKVSQHMEHCSECRGESTLLENTMLALNTGEPAPVDVDVRFRNLLGRIRDYERQLEPTHESAGPRYLETLRGWLECRRPDTVWVAACALGVVIGASAILGAWRPATVEPPIAAYEVYSETESPLRLLIRFDETPGANTLTALRDDVGQATNWRRHTDTTFFVQLNGDTTVGAVADIRARLLSHESVISVQIEAPEDEDRNPN